MMKKIVNIILLGVTLIALNACNDKSNFAYYDTDAPYMTSFGFYAEDNTGVLSKDYVVDLTANTIKGTSTVNVSVPMSPMIDKTKLIARFTLSDGTTATINGVAQVSKTTANDFSIPVDYILTKAGVNVRYAITVTKATNMKWTETATFDTYTAYGEPVMHLNPLTNEPYVGFKIRSGDDYRPVVLQLKDNAWQMVGGSPFGDKIYSSYFDMSIAPDGIPYVGYSDSEASILSGALSVQGFDGSAWNFSGGSAGVLKAQSTYVGLAALTGGELVAAQVNNAAKSDYTRRTLVVSNYKNGTWTSLTPSMLTNMVFMSNVAGGSKAAYVIAINRGAVNGVNYGYNVLKYENGEWTAMITNYLEPGNTFNNIYMIGAYVASDETPYIWTIDNASGETGVRIKYYDKESSAWTTLSGNILPLGFTPNSHTEVALAIATDGTPYVVYNNSNDQGYPYFMYLDQDTKQWSTPAKIADMVCKGLNIAFTRTGVGYVTFADDKNQVHTFKYE
jgi:hypothetical protein